MISVVDTTHCKTYHLGNLDQIPQLEFLTEEQRFDIEVVGRVLPFKINNFVTDELIQWDDVPDDPIFLLTFPQRDMLRPHHYKQMAALVRSGADRSIIRQLADRIRLELNPHPAGQLNLNVPVFQNELFRGMQHKYDQTVLFFPSQGQTCYAYCSFCFRWPQFSGMSTFKFASSEIDLLIAYLREHPEVTDVLFTGGDPLTMSANLLSYYLESLIQADIPTLRRIRIGTKTLSYWPFKFLTDRDADEVLAVFRRITEAGKHLAVMAHFNHPRELEPQAVKDAIQRVRETGAEIRTQSPLLGRVNDQPGIWADLWNEQVDLGCVPYYMFIARNTGAQDYFSVPLIKAWEIYQSASRQVSGLCRTARGPSMSTKSGKIQVMGPCEVAGEKVIALRFLQARNPDWVHRPFFAEYNDQAVWLNELKPAFGKDRFFFEDELDRIYHENLGRGTVDNFE
ncbi:Lysine 2,3-aminomutase [hydrothermal vent metagenome]|uniref:Lysine 2,3-aminomutase n=1 Tax=hydrothermal vent metagenome TaxID=652676 RepID=A0A3B0VC98_9ZZZZ